MSEQTAFEPLTSREREILTLISQNLSDREIAERLFVARSTVKWFNRQIFRKLGVENRKEALQCAAELGLLDAPDAPKTEPKHNLPAAVTPFIGRSEELDELARLITHPHTRLVTILAPGGMGKTRLALEAAESLLGQYADGVWFAPLAGLSESSQVIPVVADALGFQFMPDGRTAQQQLSDFLRRKHLLLVLDNFEHLLNAAPLIAEILAAAPQVKALVTSREKLNLTGEIVYPLAGLSYPTDKEDEPTRYAAVQLFIECALRANSRFEDHDTASMAKICRVAQGMPLAIEMAAAWAGTLSAGEIADEISRSADFLKSSMRDMPERQRSVRAVFEAAWARLDEDARRAFRWLSVFRGGCTREAAQKITGASVATLAALADKALLWRNPHAGRYEVHELLRQYAEGELEEAGESDAARQAHQEYYASLTAKWGAAMMLDKVEEGLAVFDADIENVRAAFKRASERAIPAEVEPFADLWLYYDIRAKWGEALIELETACDRLEPHDSLALARLLFMRADFYRRVDPVAEANEMSKRAVNMMQRLGERRYLPLALQAYGNGLVRSQDYQSAALNFDEGYAAAQEIGHPLMIGLFLHRFAWLNESLGKPADGLSYSIKAYGWAKKHGNLWALCFMANSLAKMNLIRERLEDARLYFSEALEVSRHLRFPMQLRFALLGLSDVAYAQRNFAASREYWREMLDLVMNAGYLDIYVIDCHTVIADNSIMLGELEEARSHLRESIPLMDDRFKEMYFEGWLLVADDYLIRSGSVQPGAAYLGYLSRRGEYGGFTESIEQQTYGNLAAQCRAALTPEEFEAAVTRGKALTPDAIIAELIPLL